MSIIKVPYPVTIEASAAVIKEVEESDRTDAEAEARQRARHSEIGEKLMDIVSWLQEFAALPLLVRTTWFGAGQQIGRRIRTTQQAIAELEAQIQREQADVLSQTGDLLRRSVRGCLTAEGDSWYSMCMYSMHHLRRLHKKMAAAACAKQTFLDPVHHRALDVKTDEAFAEASDAIKTLQAAVARHAFDFLNGYDCHHAIVTTCDQSSALAMATCPDDDVWLVALSKCVDALQKASDQYVQRVIDDAHHQLWLKKSPPAA